MATIKICDRCGTEIKPKSSAVYVLLKDYNGCHIGAIETELCCSCATHIKDFLKPLADKERSTE